MPTRTLLLAMLLAWPAAPLAAQEPAPPPPPPPAPPAPAVELKGSDHERVYTGDHTLERGESVEDIVVVGGDLRIRGEVTGDAVVVGGNLIMEEAGRVLGDAVVTGGEILQHGGEIRGEMRTVDGAGAAAAAGIRREMDQVRREAAAAREEAHREVRVHRDADDGRHFAWFDPIRHGFAGLISTVALGLVLAGIGAALVFYGRPYLETVSDTLRSNALRAGAVGLAAGFLIVPAFVVLVVALAVSIIGIPFLLVAIPLYPLAIAAAAAMGLLAAAHAIGERTAEQRRDAFDMRYSNSYAYLFTGLAMVLLPLVAANLLGMTGFLGFLGTLLKVITWAGIWVATTVGLGAVILSRAGTRRTFVTTPPLDPTFETDPFFEPESASRGPHA